jgi:hypothetical protein
MNSLKSWGFMRLLRFTFGVFALVQAFITLDIILGILGLIVGGMAFLNVGCCGSNGCSTNSNTTMSKQQIKDIEYEEVV